MSDMYWKAARRGSEPIVLLDPALPIRGVLVSRPKNLSSSEFTLEVEYEDRLQSTDLGSSLSLDGPTSYGRKAYIAAVFLGILAVGAMLLW